MKHDFIEALYAVEAQVKPLQDEQEFQQVVANVTASADNFPAEFVKDLSLAAPAPIIDGKPRMLHVTAFIVHEGMNRNGDRFIADELGAAVTANRLFADGYAGIIDLDHDFSPVGYWYKSEFVVDPKTNTKGILAHGAVWSYLFPEAADRVLAQQQREGFVRVSMAAISKREDVAFEVDQSGRLIKTMHNPVFLGATILLEADAGDLNAIGVVDEDPLEHNEYARRAVILKAASLNKGNEHNLEETAMIEEIRPLLAELLGDQAGKFTDSISELIATKVDGFKSLLEEKDTLISAAGEKVEGLTSQLEELNTRFEETNLALSNLKQEKEDLEAKLAIANEALEAFEQEKAEAAVEAKKEQRLSQVSEGVKTRLLAKEDEVKDKILTKWASMSEEDWETTKAELSLTEKVGTPQEPLPNPGNKTKQITDFLK